MTAKEKSVEEYAEEYVAGGLKHYATVTADICRHLSVEDAIRAKELFTIEVRRILREHREKNIKRRD